MTALDDLFSVRGRRNRRSYIEFKIVTIVLTGVLFLVAGGIPGTRAGGMIGSYVNSVMSFGFLLVVGPIFLAILVADVLVTAQRLRDMELSGWWTVPVHILWVLIPPASLVIALLLLVLPGSQGGNKYGKDPLIEFRD